VLGNPLPIFQEKILITKSMNEKVVEETLRYANQYIANKEIPPRSRIRFLTMGIIKLPKLEDYWATSWPFRNSAVADIMPRDRFTTILKFYHLNDNNKNIPKGNPGFDPLFKLRPFLDSVMNNIQSNYNLGQDLSIDEQMVSYKGRIHFLQYLPKKPTKWGMKAFVLSDSNSGYIYKWKLYTGSKYCTNKSNVTFIIIGKNEFLDTSEKSVTHATVMKLVEGLEGRGHNIYMDNYYSSPDLFLDLYDNGFGACGTVAVNRRGMPREWKNSQKGKQQSMKQGDIRFKNLNGPLNALQWKDKRTVTMLSTLHDSQVNQVSRRSRFAPGGREDVDKPRMICDYNMKMGGVDKGDQLLPYYSFVHRTVKWWKRAAFHLLEVAFMNAYLLYTNSRHDGKKLTHKAFYISLAKELLERGNALETYEHVQRPTTQTIPSRLIGVHIPGRTSLDNNGKFKQRDCHVCSERNKALCMNGCFELYHTYKDPHRYL
jgi:hypothetical protein